MKSNWTQEVPPVVTGAMLSWPFHFGSARSAQDFGASAAGTAWVLYMEYINAPEAPYHQPCSLALGANMPAWGGVQGRTILFSMRRAVRASSVMMVRSACGLPAWCSVISRS